MNQINKQTFKNRKLLYEFGNKLVLSAKNKTKKLMIIFSLAFILVVNDVKPAQAIGLTTLSRPIIKIYPNYKYDCEIYANVITKQETPITCKLGEKILFQTARLPAHIYLMDNRFSSRPEINLMIQKLRGGAWPALVTNTLCIAILYSIWVLVSECTGFVYPNLGHGVENNFYQRPTDCTSIELYDKSHQQSLKTESGRNAPNIKDRYILVESRPELIIRRGQAQLKVKDHGAVAGLPYRVKKNGGTSTMRTEKNIDEFMNVIEALIEDSNSVWFENGTYQGGTDRQVQSINLYNQEENRILIFKQSTGEFITFCEPTEAEGKNLLKTGNFGGQLGWFTSRARNMPPRIKTEENAIGGITSTNCFESDVMGITPACEFLSVDEGQNLKFTPLNNFESDVMGITPLDSSSLDYQI